MPCHAHAVCLSSLIPLLALLAIRQLSHCIDHDNLHQTPDQV